MKVTWATNLFLANLPGKKKKTQLGYSRAALFSGEKWPDFDLNLGLAITTLEIFKDKIAR
jgi:hypothetical protein